MTSLASPPEFRHPLDPDPVRATKAGSVLTLGIIAAVTGFFVGGLIPATLALVLARQTRTEVTQAQGFLTGDKALRVGVRLAWLGIALAGAALVILAIIGLLRWAGNGTGTDYAPTVN